MLHFFFLPVMGNFGFYFLLSGCRKSDKVWESITQEAMGWGEGGLVQICHRSSQQGLGVGVGTGATEPAVQMCWLVLTL